MGFVRLGKLILEERTVSLWHEASYSLENRGWIMKWGFLLLFFSFNLHCVELDQGSYHSKMSLKRWTGRYTLFCMLMSASPARFLLCSFIIKFHTGLNFGMIQKKMNQELMKRKIQQRDNGKLMVLLFQNWGGRNKRKGNAISKTHLLLFLSS